MPWRGGEEKNTQKGDGRVITHGERAVHLGSRGKQEQGELLEALQIGYMA